MELFRSNSLAPDVWKCSRKAQPGTDVTAEVGSGQPPSHSGAVASCEQRGLRFKTCHCGSPLSGYLSPCFESLVKFSYMRLLNCASVLNSSFSCRYFDTAVKDTEKSKIGPAVPGLLSRGGGCLCMRVDGNSEVGVREVPWSGRAAGQ